MGIFQKNLKIALDKPDKCIYNIDITNMEKKMPTTRRKPRTKVEPETVTPIRETIPDEQLREFVGKVPNLLRIDSCHVHTDKFRINVWTEEFKDERVIPSFSIVKSYYVKYEDGVIYDETIAKKGNPDESH